MKTLFVLHTQYNLILATGLSQEGDDLILFKDFNLSNDLMEKLERHFCQCEYFEGAYPKREYTWKQKLSKIDDDIKRLHRFLRNNKYDRLVVVEDMCIQEMFIMKCVYKFNKDIELASMEDGAITYFDNGVKSSGMGGTPFKRFVRKCFFSIRYGLLDFYDLAPCTGGHKMNKRLYTLFPDAVRNELKSKILVEIKQDQLLYGMNYIYAGTPFQFKENSILIAMDKLSVYGLKTSLVNEIIKEVVNKAVENKQEVYYKYHPRETEELDALHTAIEISRDIALESYLINSNTRNLKVVGIKSTSLQIAKKLGYEALSYINRVETSEKITTFYNRIGVEVR